MEESSAFEWFIEKGEIRHCRKTLIRQGRKLFGEPSTQVEAEVMAIEDLDRLDRMTDAILTAKSWEELLTTE